MELEFTEKELKMIEQCDKHVFDLVTNNKFINSSAGEVRILEMVAMSCFLENRQGKAVDSLRRCLINLNNCSVYRHTPEWDALIKLD